MDIVPGYWALVEQKAAAGVIKSPRLVFTEVVDNGTLPDGSKDDLARWLVAKEAAIIVESDQNAQRFFTQIANYVSGVYEPQKVQVFLSGADAWVISHALAYGGRVVSMETREPPSKNKKSVKIPDVCDHFGVGHADPIEMLRQLGASFVLAEG